MKKLKTIVVEDERLPRMTLLAKLEDYRQTLEVVDACDSYDSAFDSILRNRPDLLLLDIQLQGRDSIMLLEELRKTIPLPYVIFTTAYSDREYLMSAIKLSAVDYLLKPIGKEELSAAIAKVADRFRSNDGPAAALHDRISFKSVNCTLFIAAADIAWFKAEGNYSTLVSFSGKDLILENLLSLEKRLPAGCFARADRSTIVNISRLYRIDQQQRSCTFRSETGLEMELALSKSGIDTILELMQ